MEKSLLCALKNCALFQNMSLSAIENVLKGVSIRLVHYGKNDVYAVSGGECRYTDIMITGSMIARMTGLSGRQVEVIRLKRGDVIAPCFLYSSQSSLPVTIETEDRVSVMRFSMDALHALIDNNMIVRWNFIRMLSDLSHYLVTKIKFLSLMTLREKILYLIHSETMQQDSKTIVLARSRQRIADSLAVQKYSVLRCLSDLVRQGIISVKGRVITVIDPMRLQR